MIRFVAKRFLLGLFVLAGISIVTFSISRAVPSNPAALWVGPRATAEQIEAAKLELGLDKPMPIQYLNYMEGLFSGDWGNSIRTHQAVKDEIFSFVAATLELVLAGLLIAVMIGIPLGVISAVKKDSIVDQAIRVISVSGVSLPTFWIGLIFQLLFFKALRLFPLGERVGTQIALSFPIRDVTGFYLFDALIQGNFIFFQDALLHLVLPALAVAIYPLGLIIKLIRSSMIEVLNSDYIRVLEAFGIPERRRVFVYSLKNALSATVTSVGLMLANALTSTFLVESVFSWPGLGMYTAKAILSNDYPVTMAVTFLVALFYIVTNILVDVVLGLLNPTVNTFN